MKTKVTEADKDRMDIINKIVIIKDYVKNKELSKRLDHIKNEFLNNNTVTVKNKESLLNLPEDIDVRSSPKKTEDITKIWAEFLEKNKKPFMSLYVHIPFCFESRCRFCREYSTILNDKKELDRYLKYLTEEINHYTPLFSNNVFNNLFVGGGTPSIFSPEQLEYFCKLIYENFKIDMDKQCTIEMSPETATEEKIDIVRKYGFNRINLGIQSMDKNVLAINNRKYIPYPQLKKLFDYIKSKDFSVFTVDVMVDLTGDTIETFLSGLEKLADLGPDAIVLSKLQKKPMYRASLIKERYPDQNGNTNVSSDYKNANYSIPELYGKAEILLNKSGYYKKMGCIEDVETHFFKKGVKEFVMYSVRNKKNDNCLLGLGIGAISKISYELEYANMTNLKSNYSFENTVYYGYERGLKEHMRRHLVGTLINQTPFQEIQINDFRKRFNKDFFDEFKDELDVLKIIGILVNKTDKVLLFPRNEYERIFVIRVFDNY